MAAMAVRTEVADERSLVDARRPLAVRDGAVAGDVEPEFLVSSRKCVIATLRLLDALLPRLVDLPARRDGWDFRLQVSVEREHGLGVECHGCPSS